MDTNHSLSFSPSSVAEASSIRIALAGIAPDVFAALSQPDASGHALMRDGQPEHLEIKDPSIIRTAEGDYVIYASVGRSDVQKWNIGRFVTRDLTQPWTLESLTDLKGLEHVQDSVIVDMAQYYQDNPEAQAAYRESIKDKHWIVLKETCAPAMTYEVKHGKPHYTLYVQTACFHKNGVIVQADSEDGIHFTVTPEPVITPRLEVINDPALPPVTGELVGVYDISHSRIHWQGRPHECLTFTGTTEVDGGAVGDIYCMLRDSTKPGAEWSMPVKILQQDMVPFHNASGAKKRDGHAHSMHSYDGHYEWCIEGTQIVDLGDGHYLMAGVCFLDKPEGHNGERQRVFFGAAESPLGPFTPIHTPLQPIHEKGENGHPDTVIEDGKMHLIYQERHGDGQPWHLRGATYELEYLRALANTALETAQSIPEPYCLVVPEHRGRTRERIPRVANIRL